MKRFILVLFLLFSAVPSWAATTYYVDSSCAAGTDYDPVSRTQGGSVPVTGGQTSYTAIGAAFSALTLGSDDIIDVRAGTYTEKVTPGSTDDGTTGHPSILRGHAGELVVVDGAGQNRTLALTVTNNITVRDMTIIGGSNIAFSVESALTGVTVDNMIIDSGVFGMYLYGQISNILISDTTIRNITHHGLYINPGAPGKVITGKITDVNITSCKTGIEIQNAELSRLVFSNVKTHGNTSSGMLMNLTTGKIDGGIESYSNDGNGFAAIGKGNTTLQKLNAHNNTLDGFVVADTGGKLNCKRCVSYDNGINTATYDAGDGYTARNASVLNLESCLGYGNGSSGFAAANTTSGSITNCVFYDNGVIHPTTKAAQIYFANTSGAWVVKNNITLSTSLGSAVRSVCFTPGFTDGTSTYVGNNNIYTEDYFTYGSTAATLAEWQAINAGYMALQDGDSFITDPLLLNPANNDFRPSSLSPTRQAGIVVGYIRDYNGRPFKFPPSIGAYEFTSGFPAKTTGAGNVRTPR